MPTDNRCRHGMRRPVEDTKSHIQVMDTQRRDFGIHQAGEVGGRVKLTKRQLAHRGFIKLGTGRVREIVVGGIIRG